jgi:hypothetical protein
MLLGNGVETKYHYEPDTRRLSLVSTDYQSYLLGYQYAGPAPHAATHIDEALQGNVTTPRDVLHDLDGNQTGWTFKNGTSGVQTWSEEDRLREVKDQGHVFGHYLYNADGVRTHSVVDGDETAYVNQHLTVRNGMFYTQHIYAGDTRIASKVNADSLNNPSTLWYHPDHLQSTQFVSVDDQTLVQHMEYDGLREGTRDNCRSTASDLFEASGPTQGGSVIPQQKPMREHKGSK